MHSKPAVKHRNVRKVRYIMHYTLIKDCELKMESTFKVIMSEV